MWPRTEVSIYLSDAKNHRKLFGQNSESWKEKMNFKEHTKDISLNAFRFEIETN